MNILITNDDGVFAEGIKVLATWARKLGNVTVVAPKSERSAASHSMNIHTPYEIVKCDIGIEGITAYSVDSSPADCARFGLVGLDTEFDIVFSGINRGMNLGNDIGYSGTCGACFEAAYYNAKAVAFSTFPQTFESAEKELDRIWDFFETNRLMDLCDLYNVNIPLESKGICITHHGEGSMKDLFEKVSDTMFKSVGYYTFNGSKDLDTDRDAVYNGYISISPMTHLTTDFKVYEKIKHLTQI